MRNYKKRLTPECHYNASIMLYKLKRFEEPEHIDWLVTDDHIKMLEMFIVKGMTANEISNSGEVLSRYQQPMSADMILLWLHRYIPDLEFDEKPTPCKRTKDLEEMRIFHKLKKTIPKTPCAVCGSSENLELDHILTVYAGGKTEPSNLQWLCHKCHMKKTNQERKQFRWTTPKNTRRAKHE